MTSRSERDRQKSQQERHQTILAELLKEEDNKYCVDCDAKGPRWASWNLGVFLCIRCAGIHRNLGVHISKVKSVNLDTWKPEQIAMVQEMGNSRARAVYEANLPDMYRRPQTDSSLEAFIRAKYEQKKYIAKEWVPPSPKVEYIEQQIEKKKTRPRPKANIQLSGPSKATSAKSESKPSKLIQNDVEASNHSPPKPEKKSNIDDLLGLDDPSPTQDGTTKNNIFDDFLSATSSPAQQPTQPASQPAQPQTENNIQSEGTAELESSLFGENAGGQKSTKESILALYGSSANQQRFGVPGGFSEQQGFGALGGMYMQQPQQQGQPQMNMMPGGVQNGMMGNNMAAPAMQGNMGMMAGMQGGNMQQQQPNMMMNQMAGMQGGMQGMGMQGGYNMAPMYGMQQPQIQQMQNQMASLNLGGGQQMNSLPQQGTVGGGGMGWAAAPTGQTLSTNLWQ